VNIDKNLARTRIRPGIRSRIIASGGPNLWTRHANIEERAGPWDALPTTVLAIFDLPNQAGLSHMDSFVPPSCGASWFETRGFAAPSP
jgi:hypothetical protein